MGFEGVHGTVPRRAEPSPFAFTMAFQPIMDIRRHAIWGYEALVRGMAGESAASILEQLNDGNRYVFDQACRVKAIELAGAFFPSDPDVKLSINFTPNALIEPAACLKVSMEAARCVGFNPEKIMFEITEGERIQDASHLRQVLEGCKRHGFITAIDDFGAGHATLSMLAGYQPDVLKIDRDLVRDIPTCRARQAIIAGVMVMARELGIQVVAEGVETEAELSCLEKAGVGLVQGFLFARPAVVDPACLSWRGCRAATSKRHPLLDDVGAVALTRLNARRRYH